ncbi:PDDEXK-like family protein [Flavobacterium poyangense]|uniref:PD-(D/E)XK nuclease family protein n=1 Tax=Flavobacterium poyangense TaxID=2204302 RepID=UPI0014226C57|nr:PD-(D/E)XK nuclease family protein [Flavobacterium sp. JXAS1]
MPTFSEIEDFFTNNDFKKVKLEDNFFNIGSRKFYENPFTEVLSYILDSETQYKGRANFIEILLKENVSDDSLQSLIGYGKTSSQFSTDNGKLIDLVFYNEDSIVVFENKIFHTANNPFADYVNDIEKKYPNHKKFFILLSYKKETPPINWEYISIKEKFKDILDTAEFSIDNKWDFFIKDFLTHFSSNGIKMTKTEKEFYEKNFAKIIKANNNLHQYVLDLAKSFVENNNLSKYEHNSNWNSETRAIRFYPFDDSKSNVVLIFETNGTFKISVYYYNDYYIFNEAIWALVGKEKYRNWNEGAICCFTQIDGTSYTNLAAALEECANQTEKMKNYSSKQDSREAI